VQGAISNIAIFEHNNGLSPTFLRPASRNALLDRALDVLKLKQRFFDALGSMGPPLDLHFGATHPSGIRNS
jgi:hypothetical protein